MVSEATTGATEATEKESQWTETDSLFCYVIIAIIWIISKKINNMLDMNIITLPEATKKPPSETGIKETQTGAEVCI